MKTILLSTMAILLLFPASAQDDLVKANNDFSIRLYNSVKTDSANLFISPFGLHMALAIVNEGAGSDTRSEMDRLLSTTSVERRPEKYRRLIDRSTSTRKGLEDGCFEFSRSNDTNELLVANSVWIRDGFEVEPDYKARIRNDYRAEIFQVNGGEGDDMNSWIARATQNKITSLPPPDPEALLTVVDAVHFKGIWDIPFDEEKTKKRKFYTISRKKVALDFMHDQSDYKYYENNELQVVSLPYKCHQFSMMVILPYKKDGLVQVEANLTPAYMSKIVGEMQSLEVILSFPKFKIESEIEPKENLEQMGYTNMFSDNADYSGISRSPRLKIGRIVHKTYITVDEKQTEAAAVSLVEMVVVGYSGGEPATPPPPKVFDADHPFMFLIVDNRTNAILFTGRFVRE